MLYSGAKGRWFFQGTPHEGLGFIGPTVEFMGSNSIYMMRLTFHASSVVTRRVCGSGFFYSYWLSVGFNEAVDNLTRSFVCNFSRVNNFFPIMPTFRR